MPFDYYTPPPQEIFDDIKQASIKLWETYDDTYGYATSKINKIKDLENVGDNATYMVAMFDQINQAKLLTLFKEPETSKYILSALTNTEYAKN